MSKDYMKARILEALTSNAGNIAQTERQIVEEAQDDSKLLKELAMPHLKGIVAHAVDWTVRSESGEAMSEPPRELSTEELGQMAEVLAGSITGGAGDKFGTQGTGLAGKPGKASEDHVAAIQQIANAASKDD